ncbi:hypothetical protein ASD24_15255 [Paenibacillus sp. Root52]|uniref:Uncharacterized protein n=1 Tax=Paenibacillus amylolyticus TaxID=1451 RepID=A0AAP5GZ75_PAEAM|nr:MULTISPECIES: hypothetical protein [Paenibacillus]KQY82732.1 hypothetical protein ASD24_15255 [Paenibacillus sp. Root52]MDR6723368.1 hypothetical protein [Paenibacillus amylolyticus]
MGLEYGIKVAPSTKIPEVIERLSSVIIVHENYSIEHTPTGFAIVQDHAAWPEVMQLSIEQAVGLEEVEDGMQYIYCLFHIGGELTSNWLRQMQTETERIDGLSEWFEF